jgi:uncharacterized protein (DUF2252 family)
VAYAAGDKKEASRRSVTTRILRFNAGRDPERLAMKYAAMRRSPFAFLRGTCHLFWEDWPRNSPLDTAPMVWVCGDLHFENFGTYKGDNRLVYFDINDFDEAVLAPCTFDVTRFLTSLLVATQMLRLGHPQARRLGKAFLDAYAAALVAGKARWVERATATGIVRELLRTLKTRKRRQLLKRKTILEGERRRIRRDGKHALPTTRKAQRKVKTFMAAFAERQPKPRFFEVLDVARRIAGTGSLGVERYAILVEGKGSPDRNYLLDLKEARPSSVLPALPGRAQPDWRSEAERVVTVQRRTQAISPALLRSVEIEGKSFVLRELQPVEDRLALVHWKHDIGRLEGAITTMAKVLAWAHLRGSGHQGAAIPDALIELGHERRWAEHAVRYAIHYATKVERDWQAFRRARSA